MADLDQKALEAAARAIGAAHCRAYANDAIWAEDVEWQRRRVDKGSPFCTAREAIAAYLSALTEPTDER
jgi:hypothetical protein